MSNTKAVYTPFHILKKDKKCVNCTHFYQHYVLSDGRYIPIYAGHCAYPRLKDRTCNDTCKYFEEE